MRVPRPVMPADFRGRVFLSIYNLAHVGTRVTRRMLTKRWVWMGMQGDISRNYTFSTVPQQVIIPSQTG